MRSLVTSPIAADDAAAAAEFAGVGGGGGALRMSTAATGWAGLATELAPVSAAVASLLLLSFLPGEVFGGEAGAEAPGVLAAIAFAAAANAVAFGCEFGSFGSLGVFAVDPAAGVVPAGVLAAVLLGALATLLSGAGVALLLDVFGAELLRFLSWRMGFRSRGAFAFPVAVFAPAPPD